LTRIFNDDEDNVAVSATALISGHHSQVSPQPPRWPPP
jgi:hypothetical protein